MTETTDEWEWLDRLVLQVWQDGYSVDRNISEPDYIKERIGSTNDAKAAIQAEFLKIKKSDEFWEKYNEENILKKVQEAQDELNEEGLKKFLSFISEHGEFEYSSDVLSDTTLFRISNEVLDRYGLMSDRVDK